MASSIGAENSSLDEPVAPDPVALAEEEALAEVRERLFAEPWGFDFFQAVRLLALLQPERSPVGRYANPADETIRFGVNPSLTFPPSAIHGLTERPGEPAAMTVNFMGLVGPVGALPNYMTEIVAQRSRLRDTSLRDFLNIFNHRIISLFYKAWEKHRFTVGYERDRSDPVTNYVLALVGLGTPKLRNRQAVRDELFVFYSGLFALAPKSATALESILSDFFAVPVEVESFIGAWRRLDDNDQCFLTQESESDQLGWGAVVGDEVWDQQSRIRICIGPLNAEQHRDFLPTGSAWPLLQAIARMFCGSDLEFETKLILRRDEVPACELRDPATDGPELGWRTWLKSKPDFAHDGIVIVGG